MTTQAPEIQVTDKWRVACDGGDGALGHPRVWLSLDEKTGQAVCPYCDKQIVHESVAKG